MPLLYIPVRAFCWIYLLFGDARGPTAHIAHVHHAQSSSILEVRRIKVSNMALGILEPREEHVAGTVYVKERTNTVAAHPDDNSHLKRDKKGTTILVPQPSNDPNDPLVSASEAVMQ